MFNTDFMVCQTEEMKFQQSGLNTPTGYAIPQDMTVAHVHIDTYSMKTHGFQPHVLRIANKSTDDETNRKRSNFDN